ncbi:hypothetical protein L328_0123580 [Yersinia pestis 24H]|nr:hypothetical protein L328_0123580 [Yersinia pestis 24H]
MLDMSNGKADIAMNDFLMKFYKIQVILLMLI